MKPIYFTLLLLISFCNTNILKAQINTYETSNTGKRVYIIIDPSYNVSSISSTAVFTVVTKNNVNVPVISRSFTSDTIILTLAHRLIYDDGTNIKLSYTGGAIRYTNGTLMNRFSNAPIINKVRYLAQSNETAVSNWISSKNVQLGVSDFTGGYVAQLLLYPGGPNINAPQYGRGIQTALRSRMHSNFYIPNNAGQNVDVGVLGRLRDTISGDGTGGKVLIDEFNMPLFNGETDKFDFVKNETPIIKDRVYTDGGNTDTDFLPEIGTNYVDEYRSELSYSGSWEDASNLSSQNIAIFKSNCIVTYNENPKAILQFGANAKNADMTPVIDNDYRVTDISPTTPGNQQAADDDISTFLCTYWGMRPYVNQGFKYAMWVENGQTTWSNININDIYQSGVGGIQRWKVKSNQALIDLFPIGNTSIFSESKNTSSGTVASDFPTVIMTDGTDPNTAKAIGVFLLPENKDGNFQVVDANKNLLKTEDRFAYSYIEADIRGEAGSEYLYMRNQTWATGLRAPNKFANGEKDQMNITVLYLFGTPNQIKAAYQEIVKVAILDSINEWYHNYKTNEFKATTGTVNTGTLATSQTTPTITGNESNLVSKFVKSSGSNSSVTFALPGNLTDINNAIFKIRVYTPTNTTATNNNIRMILRKDGYGLNQLSITKDVTKFDQWVDYTFDFSSLTMKETYYNEISLFFAQPDTDLDATGNIYYFDAFQGPKLSTTSTTLATISTEKHPNVDSNLLVNIVPNPTSVKFGLTQKILSAKVYNMNGQILLVFKNNQDSYDVSTLSSGVYILTVEMLDGNKQSMRFIKE